jgi:hypothetical protein
MSSSQTSLPEGQEVKTKVTVAKVVATRAKKTGATRAEPVPSPPREPLTNVDYRDDPIGYRVDYASTVEEAEALMSTFA